MGAFQFTGYGTGIGIHGTGTGYRAIRPARSPRSGAPRGVRECGLVRYRSSIAAASGQPLYIYTEKSRIL